MVCSSYENGWLYIRYTFCRRVKHIYIDIHTHARYVTYITFYKNRVLWFFVRDKVCDYINIFPYKFKFSFIVKSKSLSKAGDTK